jgi:hypothetical protein
VNFVLQQERGQQNVFAAVELGGQPLAAGVFQVYTTARSQDTGFSLLNGGNRKQSPQTPFKVVEPRRFAVGGRAREASPRNFNGQVAEILIYNRVLKDDERQATENYLAQKYSITLAR